jgi:hypothetical protein
MMEWIVWTARLALACYVVGLALRLLFRPRASRFAWTVGCLIYLAHVVSAFEYAHHWSHQEAYDSTARQTEAVVGWYWGGGLYINYVFTLVWLLDVCWWWLSPQSYLRRPAALEWTVQGFMGFIAFNATVIFAIGPSRWFGIFACIVLAGAWAWRRS